MSTLEREKPLDVADEESQGGGWENDNSTEDEKVVEKPRRRGRNHSMFSQVTPAPEPQEPKPASADSAAEPCDEAADDNDSANESGEAHKGSPIDFDSMLRSKFPLKDSERVRVKELLGILHKNSPGSPEFDEAYNAMVNNNWFLAVAGNQAEFSEKAQGWYSKVGEKQPDPTLTNGASQPSSAAARGKEPRNLRHIAPQLPLPGMEQPQSNEGGKLHQSSALRNSPQAKSRKEEEASSPVTVKKEGGETPSDDSTTNRQIANSPTTLKLHEIVTDTGVQGRASINVATVNEYAERLEAGDKFPPLTVFDLGGKFLLADGFHRHAAASKAKLETVEVDIRQGTRTEAITFAITANATHGLARTNADKKRAVMLALEQFPDWSDHRIADLAKVSQPFVSGLRPQLKTIISSETRTGLDGKKRKVRESKSKAKKPQPKAESRPALKQETPEQDSITAAHTGEASQSGSGAEFNVEDTWASIAKYLTQQLERWPVVYQAEFGLRLRTFAEGLAVSGKEGE